MSIATSSPYEVFANAMSRRGKSLGPNGRWQCPGHDGDGFNLLVTQASDGKLLFSCKSHNCSHEEICSGLGLKPSDCFPKVAGKIQQPALASKTVVTVQHNPGGNAQRRELLPPVDGKKLHATPKDAVKAVLWSLCENEILESKRPPDTSFLYFDCGEPSQDDILFAYLRWELTEAERQRTGDTKAIRPICQVQGGWQVGNPYSDRPLFGLSPRAFDYHSIPDVSDAEEVFIVEGEKACCALLAIGVNAVSPSQGANCPHKTDWRILDGKRLILTPDDDPAGRVFIELLIRILKAQCPNATIEVRHFGDDPSFPVQPKDDAAEWVEFHREKTHAQLRSELAKLPNRVSEYADCQLANTSEGESTRTPWVFRSAWDAVQNPQAMREPIVEGLVRRGEVLNIVAATKIGKSWLAMLLLLCVSTGRDWLGRATKKGRVLLVDNELHHETLQNRIAAVARAAEFAGDESAANFQFVTCRGEVTSIDDIELQLATFKPREFTLIVLDAKYRFFGELDENSNSDQTAFHNTIDRLAKQLDCVIVLVHHSTKGDQAGRAVTDVGSGGGAQARTVDCHMVIRPHSGGPDLAVLDAAVRSFPAVESQTLRWNYPIWHLESDVAACVQSSVAQDSRRETEKKDKQANIMELLRVEPTHILSESKLSGGHPERKAFRAAIRELQQDGLIEFVQGYIPPRSKSEVPAWRLGDDVQD